MSDDAWSNFVAQLDPAAVEQERYRPPADDERPGSMEDQRMRTAHAFIAADYWARVRAGHPLPFTDDEWAARRAAQNADADREIHARGFDVAATDEQDNDIEAAIRSYSQRHNERHAA